MVYYVSVDVLAPEEEGISSDLKVIEGSVVSNVCYSCIGMLKLEKSVL